MIYNVRTAGISQGKAREATAWAVKAANWINEKYTGTNLQVLTNISGNLTDIHWLWTSDSLGDVEQLMAQLQGDDEYQAMLTDAMSQRLFAEGTLRQTFYRTVEG